MKVGRFRLVVLVGAIAPAMAGFAVPTASASASVALLTCTGTQVTTYSPPLTNTPNITKITITDYFGDQDHVGRGSCVAAGKAAGKGISGGTSTLVVTAPAADCGAAVVVGTDTYTYKWSFSGPHTGPTTSTVTYKTAVTRLGNGSTLVASAGKVDSGLFSQPVSVANRNVVKPELGIGLCSTTGEASDQGLATLTILGA